MLKMKILKYSSVLLATLISACNQQVENQNMKDVVDPIKGDVILTQTQITNAGIKYGEISKHLLSQDVHAQGRLVIPPNSEADVVTFCDGVVKNVHVNLGSHVSRGQLLAMVISPEFIAKQQDYLTARSNLDLWEEELKRKEALNRENISSDKQFQQVKASYLEASAAYNALKIEMKILGVNTDKLEEGIIAENMMLSSPITGYVDEIMVNNGKYIQPGLTLFKVVDRTRLFLELMVFEKDIMKIKTGQRVDFTLGNLDNKQYETFISSISGIVKPEARVVKAIAEFNNESNELLPGMFVSAKIHTSENYLDALPEQAVIFDGDFSYHIYYTLPSWVKEEQVVFHRAAVKRGFVEDGFAQVTLVDELPEGAMIVTEGSYYLYSAELLGEE
jgi:cobalt-zinc-cadmium efflux system membrane fusion protein